MRRLLKAAKNCEAILYLDYLQVEYRLVSFIEEEVQNAHIRLETVLLFIDLIIALGSEFCVRKRLLWANSIAEINYTLNFEI